MNVRASDPVGVYALVDKVVLEPNEKSPERIQIWGTFATWADHGDVYGKPEKGFLYYKIPATNAKAALAEWADLKAIAGTGQGVAFGQRYSQMGRVRPATEKPESPDVYVLGVGLTKVGYGASHGSSPDNMKRVVGELKSAK
jgi:hypothetical protein